MLPLSSFCHLPVSPWPHNPQMKLAIFSRLQGLDLSPNPESSLDLSFLLDVSLFWWCSFHSILWPTDLLVLLSVLRTVQMFIFPAMTSPTSLSKPPLALVFYVDGCLQDSSLSPAQAFSCDTWEPEFLLFPLSEQHSSLIHQANSYRS